jgi:hypothetical protein
MNSISTLKPATHRSGPKLVEHLFHPFDLVGLRKIEVVCDTIPGGYWDGSRMFIGTQNDREVFRVSVVDSGEGGHHFRQWLEKHGLTRRVEYVS